MQKPACTIIIITILSPQWSIHTGIVAGAKSTVDATLNYGARLRVRVCVWDGACIAVGSDRSGGPPGINIHKHTHNKHSTSPHPLQINPHPTPSKPKNNDPPPPHTSPPKQNKTKTPPPTINRPPSRSSSSGPSSTSWASFSPSPSSSSAPPSSPYVPPWAPSSPWYAWGWLAVSYVVCIWTYIVIGSGWCGLRTRGWLAGASVSMSIGAFGYA